MKQFNIQRFVKLVCWSLAIDRSWFLGSVVRYVVTMTLMFLFFTFMVNFDSHNNGMQAYQVCAVLSFVALVIWMVFGFTMRPAWTRNDDQRLLMLPASNLEKYLMRYSYWLLLVPFFLLSFAIADGVQFVVNTLLGHEWASSVIGYMANSQMFAHFPNQDKLFFGFFILGLWVHSLYTVGGSFFRAHKYCWILTSVVLVAAYMLLAALNLFQMINLSWWKYIGYYNLLFLVLTLFNFWLSYWLFCRQQLIGKFVNI